MKTLFMAYAMLFLLAAAFVALAVVSLLIAPEWTNTILAEITGRLAS